VQGSSQIPEEQPQKAWWNAMKCSESVHFPNQICVTCYLDYQDLTPMFDRHFHFTNPFKGLDPPTVHGPGDGWHETTRAGAEVMSLNEALMASAGEEA
jgi:hypothetical protein